MRAQAAREQLLAAEAALSDARAEARALRAEVERLCDLVRLLGGRGAGSRGTQWLRLDGAVLCNAPCGPGFARQPARQLEVEVA